MLMKVRRRVVIVRDAPCDICGVRHKDQNKPNKCHANLLAQGKPVPGWNDKPPEFKERPQKRADEIKEHCPWKDRPGRQNTGGGSGVNMRPLLMLLGSLPQAQMATTLKPTFGSARLLIDSQTIDRTGGTQYHLIKSENHFTSIDKNAAPVPVAPAKNGVAPMLSIGVGTCTYVTMMGELRRCTHVYWFLILHNLINVKRVQSVTPTSIVVSFVGPMVGSRVRYE